MAHPASRALRIERVELPVPGSAVRVEVDGRPIAVFNVGGRLFALDARCTHAGGPLDQGKVDDHSVQCPLHGSIFDLGSGAVQRGPAARPVRSYRVRQDAQALVIEPIEGAPP